MGIVVSSAPQPNSCDEVAITQGTNWCQQETEKVVHAAAMAGVVRKCGAAVLLNMACS